MAGEAHSPRHSERRRRIFEGARRVSLVRQRGDGGVILSVSEISSCVRICFVHFFLFAATKKKEKTLPKRNLEFFF